MNLDNLQEKKAKKVSKASKKKHQSLPSNPYYPTETDTSLTEFQHSVNGSISSEGNNYSYPAPHLNESSQIYIEQIIPARALSAGVIRQAVHDINRPDYHESAMEFLLSPEAKFLCISLGMNYSNYLKVIGELSGAK